MRNLFLLFVVSFSLANCTMPQQRTNDKMVDDEVVADKDTFHLLCQYWQLEEADNPTSKDISFKENGIEFKSGIVFMTDSVMLENPKGKMNYGKFRLDENAINVIFDNGGSAVYKIGRINKDELLLRRTENKHVSQLTFKASHTYWPDADKNPFSKENFKWVQKPTRPENAEEIKRRAKESVQFYAYYLTGFVNGGATTIDFEAIPCCFNWYAGGISIQSETKLDKKWIDCFYSKEQAFEARQILEDAILKKYDWDTTETDWVKQTIPVLQQIHDGL
jgi:hypothetical protein